jgi:hypothetical protein
MALAISLVMEKVVVVVVVTTREGSLGSGPRLEEENLREAKFWAASSLEHYYDCQLSIDSGELRTTYVVKEWENVLKNCLWGASSRDTIRVANRSRVS